MHIQDFPSGPYLTNAYVIACEETKQAVIIDAPPNSFIKISDYLTQHNLQAKKLILTHSHWDHIGEAKRWQDERSLPLYIHTLDAPNLRTPGADGLPIQMTIPGTEPDFLLDEQTEIQVGKLIFTVIHTPGHSPGSICLFESQHHILFSGDTIFKGTIGNVSFPTSQPRSMITSLDKLSRLPLHTKIYPGHGPKTILSEEIRWFPKQKNYLMNLPE